jgi:hypothetical protein
MPRSSERGAVRRRPSFAMTAGPRGSLPPPPARRCAGTGRRASRNGPESGIGTRRMAIHVPLGRIPALTRRPAGRSLAA